MLVSSGLCENVEKQNVDVTGRTNLTTEDRAEDNRGPGMPRLKNKLITNWLRSISAVVLCISY